MHTIFDSCPEGNGIQAIAITRDAKYLATISDAEIQVEGPLGWPQRAGQLIKSVEQLCSGRRASVMLLGDWTPRHVVRARACGLA